MRWYLGCLTGGWKVLGFYATVRGPPLEDPVPRRPKVFLRQAQTCVYIWKYCVFMYIHIYAYISVSMYTHTHLRPKVLSGQGPETQKTVGLKLLYREPSKPIGSKALPARAFWLEILITYHIHIYIYTSIKPHTFCIYTHVHIHMHYMMHVIYYYSYM